MNEREALLRALCDNPDEDTPRLVFADWLQENGEEERAEFIRVQIERSTLPRESIPWWKCYSRARKLFTNHGSKWCDEIHADRAFRWDEFVRGFAEGLTIRTLASFEPFAGRIFSRTPLDTIRIEEPLSLRDLCRVPRLLQLGIVCVSAGSTKPDEARQFLDAVGEDGPTILSFADRIASPEVERVLTEHFGGRLMLPEND